MERDSSSYARGVAKTTGALVVARVVVIVAGIAAVALAARHLGLEHYGALTAAMAYASMFAVLTDLGISTVATREIARAPERERQIIGNVLSLGFAFGVLAAALGVGVMFLAYPGADNTDTREGIALLLTQLAVAPFTSAARAHFTAGERGYLIAAGDAALAIGMAGLTAIVVALDGSYLAVVGAVAGGYFLQAIVMAGLALRSGGIRFKADWATSRTLVMVTLPLAATMVVNFLYFRLDILLLSWLKGDAEVAVYGVAYRVLEALMVLPAYLMLALFPEIARRGDDPARLGPLVGTALAVMEVAALPVAALTAIFAPEIVVLIGGDKYEDGALVLQLLAAALALSYLNGVYGNALLALGRQSRLLWVSLAALVVNIAVNLAMIPPLGAEGAAAAVLIAEVVAVLMVRQLYVGVAGKPPPPPHARILAAGLGLAAAIPLRLLLVDRIPDLVLVLAAGAFALLVYVLLLVAFRALPAQLAALLPFTRSRTVPS